MLPLTVVFILCSRSLIAVALSRSYRISIYLPCLSFSSSLTPPFSTSCPVPAGLSSPLTMSPHIAHPIRSHSGTPDHLLSRSNDTIPLDRPRSGRSGRACLIWPRRASSPSLHSYLFFNIARQGATPSSRVASSDWPGGQPASRAPRPTEPYNGRTLVLVAARPIGWRAAMERPSPYRARSR